MAFEVGERYLGKPDDLRFATVTVDRETPPVRIRVGWVTDQDLPRLAKKEEVSPIRLEEDQYVYFPSHMVLFNDGFLGYECSRPAPTPATLAAYINSKIEKNGYSFEPVYRPEVAADLKDMQEIHIVKIQLPVSRAAVFRERDRAISRGIRAFREWGDEFQVEVTVSPAQRRGKVKNLLARVRKFASTAKEDGATKLVVVGYDEDDHRRVLDLLSSRMLEKRQMVLQDAAHRAVSPDSAYAAIEGAFSDLEDPLYDSAGYRL
ncbi:MAG: hypothetical protein WAN77_09680 [Thermoplasmata archaeon]